MALAKFVDSKGRTVDFLFFDEVTKVFKVVKRFGDKTVKKRSLGKISEHEAKKRVLTTLIELKEEFEEDEGQRLKVEKLKKLPQNKLLKDFLEELGENKVSEGLRASTIKKYHEMKKGWIIPFCGDYTPEEITPDIRQDFIKWRDKNKPGRLLFNPFKYLDEVLSLMVHKGVILPSQKPKFDLPKAEKDHHKKKKGTIVGPEVIRAIQSKAHPDIALMVGIAYVHGMRKMEIAKLNRDNVKRINGKLVFDLSHKDVKTGIERIIPVHDQFEAEIERRLRANYWVIPSQFGSFLGDMTILRGWAVAKENAGINYRLRFHDLRGMCATNMATNNINPILACTLLGMSLKVYQEKYLKLSAADLIIAVVATPLFSSTANSIEKR